MKHFLTLTVMSGLQNMREFQIKGTREQKC